MVHNPPRWAVLAHGGLYGEYFRSRCHVANADALSIADRDDLTGPDPVSIADRDERADSCRHHGVSCSRLELCVLRTSAWTSAYDDSVLTRHVHSEHWHGYHGWQCALLPLHSQSHTSGDYGVYGFRPSCSWVDET